MRYLGGLVQGDFGPSFQYRDFSVTELIATGFPVSLRLGGAAMLIALLFGVVAGSIAAWRQNSVIDHGVMAVSMTGISIPNFVMAPILILVVRGVSRLAAGRRSRRRLASQSDSAGHALALPQIAYIRD